MIICDTTIWYDIGMGNIPVKKLANQHLVCTALSLIEIANSDNLYKRNQEAKNAINAIKNFAVCFYFEDYFGHALQKLGSNHLAKNTLAIKCWENLQQILNLDFTFSERIIKNAETIFNERKNPFIDANREFNTAIQIGKSKVGDSISSRELETKKAFVSILNTYLIENSHESFKIDLSSPKWDDLELLIEVLAEYYNMILERKGKKMQLNDWGDIFNMAYVSQGDLYWTNEPKWNILIKKNPKTEKYLFQLN